MRAIADQRDPSLRDALREGGWERKQHSKNNMERESGELFLLGRVRARIQRSPQTEQNTGPERRSTETQLDRRATVRMSG